MKKNYSNRSLKEVYDVINKSNREVRNKIPYKFKKYVYKNMDKEHKIILEYDKSLNQQENLSKETRELIALIYRDYLVDENIREKLINEEKKYF